VLGIEPPYVAEQIAKHVITWPVLKLTQSVCKLQPCPDNQIKSRTTNRCNDCYLIQPYLCRINTLHPSSSLGLTITFALLAFLSRKLLLVCIMSLL
jgi:hypothetical protein